MIAKIVARNRFSDEEYKHEIYLEAGRIEIRFQREWTSKTEKAYDWVYADTSGIPSGLPFVEMHTWKTGNATYYGQGAVLAGQIFLMNDDGRTIDRIVVTSP
jgi:hypothetical protein